MAKLFKGDSLLAHIDFNVVQESGTSDYNNLENQPIKIINSMDSTNPVNLRSLESGLYRLYGYFKPYEDYTGNLFTVPAPLFSAVVNNGTITYIQLYFAYGNMIQYFELTDSDFTNKNIMLNDLATESGETLEKLTISEGTVKGIINHVISNTLMGAYLVNNQYLVNASSTYNNNIGVTVYDFVSSIVYKTTGAGYSVDTLPSTIDEITYTTIELDNTSTIKSLQDQISALEERILALENS